MTHIHLPRPWNLPESATTPEEVYVNRRDFLRRMGFAVGGAALLGGCDVGDSKAGTPSAGGEGSGGAAQAAGPLDNVPPTPTAGLYPEAKKDDRFGPGPRIEAVTDEKVTAAYNNFYEFTTDKKSVWKTVGRFEARPWTVEVGGLVESPKTFDLADLERTMGLETRIYRHRCVEAWTVCVPWIGFPLRALLDRVSPRSEGRYVRFVSFDRPDQAPGQKSQDWYPWPYYEALRMEEARNELAFLVTGMYGHPLQKQDGAPLRLHLPWKYGYKSIKSIVKIEVTREKPPVFWHDVVPDEYGWLANVNPAVPHPRWSQARETIVETGRKVPTEVFNGYGKWVSDLYTKEEMSTLS